MKSQRLVNNKWILECFSVFWEQILEAYVVSTISTPQVPSDGRTRKVYSHSPLCDASELSKHVAGTRFALFGGWLGPLLQPGVGGHREGVSLPRLVQQRPGDWQGGWRGSG